MIVSKTPFRISFFGGGSDLPSFYNQSPGMVVSATIDKYIYISLNKKFDNSIRLSYSITENVDESLLDNALGYSNENAPGAHRLKLIPTLVAKNREKSLTLKLSS